jgi:AraC-like DNA-binding protein
VLPPYREYPPPAGLERAVACLWENERAHSYAQGIVPDGCVDLVWLAERGLVIFGADTGPRVVDLPAGTRSSGIRLRPGAAGAFLGMPASEVCDQDVPARQLWSGRATELEWALSLSEGEPAGQLALLAGAVAACHIQPDPLALAAAQRLACPGARVASVAGQLGLSQRQLHRRMLLAVGYGPKMLARVARLRRLIALPRQPLALRALEAGYASQAHMSDEVRRLTGSTPVRFLQDATLTAA